MCGHVGVAGFIDDRAKRMFRDLLIFDSVRGPHSTGMGFVGVTNNVNFVKLAGNPFQLFEEQLFKDAFLGNKQLLLGHNRYATVGSVISSNAHPFKHGSICGAHNGTLTKQYLLDSWTKFDVDSDNIFHHLNLNGVDDTVSKLCGAYALVWYDETDRSINFLRNEERELFFAYTHDRKTLYWASEEDMLIAAANRNLVFLKDVEQVKAHKHYKFILPERTAADTEKTAKTFTDISVVDVEPHKDVFSPKQVKGVVVNFQKKVDVSPEALVADYAPFLSKRVEFFIQGTGANGANERYIDATLMEDHTINIRLFPSYGGLLWDSLAMSPNIWSGVAKKFTPSDGGFLVIDLRTLEDKGDLFDNVDIPFKEGGYKVYGGRLVDILEYDRVTSQGCCWCSGCVGYADAPKLVWVSPDEFVCPDCQDNKHVQDYLKNL